MLEIIAIARNTYREAIRDRILYGFLFFAVCLLLFSFVLGQLSFGEEVRATVDVGLAGISFFAVLISIFLGISLLHKEIEKRTLYTILARPISRGAYLVGKFLGLTATVLVQIGLMVVVWFAIIKIQGGDLTTGMLLAVLLIVCEAVLVTAMALFFTSFTSPFLSGLFCLGLFAAGRNIELVGQLARRRDLEWMAPLLDGVEALLPNFYLFFPSGKVVEGMFATIHGQFITSGYLLYTILYGLGYTALFLVASVLLINRRDFV